MNTRCGPCRLILNIWHCSAQTKQSKTATGGTCYDSRRSTGKLLLDQLCSTSLLGLCRYGPHSVSTISPVADSEDVIVAAQLIMIYTAARLLAKFKIWVPGKRQCSLLTQSHAWQSSGSSKCAHKLQASQKKSYRSSISLRFSALQNVSTQK